MVCDCYGTRQSAMLGGLIMLQTVAANKACACLCQLVQIVSSGMHMNIQAVLLDKQLKSQCLACRGFGHRAAKFNESSLHEMRAQRDKKSAELDEVPDEHNAHIQVRCAAVLRAGRCAHSL